MSGTIVESRRTATPCEPPGGDGRRPTNGPASLVDALNLVLADSFALYLKTKGFHWHVSGPHFRDYHSLFDAQAEEIIASTDAIAERIRKSGGDTLRSIGDIARRQTLRDNDRPGVFPADMLSELRDDNLQPVASLRHAKRLAEAGGDNGASGLIDGWTDAAEQRAWFLLETSRH